MTPEQKLKEAEVRAQFDRSLGEYPENVRDFLLTGIKESGVAKSYILGNGAMPSKQELTEDIWLTPTGKDLKEILEDREGHQKSKDQSSREQKLAEIQKLPPAERISAARKEGLEK